MDVFSAKQLHIQRFLSEVSQERKSRYSFLSGEHSDTEDHEQVPSKWNEFYKQKVGSKIASLDVSKLQRQSSLRQADISELGHSNLTVTSLSEKPGTSIMTTVVENSESQEPDQEWILSQIAEIMGNKSNTVTCSQTSTMNGDASLNASDQQKLQDQKPNDEEMSMYAGINDLTHLVGPLTENSLIKCLQARFYTQACQTKIGPVLLSVNGFQQLPPPTALSAQGQVKGSHYHQEVIEEVISNYGDTGHSQVIVVSGETGSGKTFCSHQLLRQLFDMAGGGPATDAFKHLQASLTVLQSLGSAATISNTESSRVGYFIENFISENAIYRTKVHCYVLDRDRVVNVAKGEKNFHIFYQMLAGLTAEEKVKFHLTGYSLHNLHYLSTGITQQNEGLDRERFQSWKMCLSVLGIPFSDVMRVMSAVLLLGNIEFVEGAGLELDLVGNNELKAVAALLGVSGVSLYSGFTTKTRNVRGQVCKSIADIKSANSTRDALAKALYCRTLMAILRRANSMKRPTSTVSTESLDSSHDNVGFTSLSRQMSTCTSIHNHWDRSQYNSFISVLDMFGFEVAQTNHLDQFCSNLCAETMQHFYTTHVFKRTQDALQADGIQTEQEVIYFDNEPILELLTTQKCGVMSLIEESCALPKMKPEKLVSKVKSFHRVNSYFFEPLPKDESVFGIRHFAGRVVYDVSSFIASNKDHICDDIVSAFSRQFCNFGFVSHLFAQEMKLAAEAGGGPRGVNYRILPYSLSHSTDPTGSQGTMSHDFQCRLDNLLKIVMQAQPHFVRCMRANDYGETELFDKEVITRQLRSLQVLETVKLMAAGIPHKMRFKAFKQRYKLFLTQRPSQRPDTLTDYCKMILDNFLQAMDESELPYVSTHWSLGKKYIYFSESTRQHLEAVRRERLNRLVCRIQSMWRGYYCRKTWPSLKEKLLHLQQRRVIEQIHSITQHRPSVKGENPAVQCDWNRNLLEKAAAMYSIDLHKPPSLPPSRNYTIHGNVKLPYPQVRVLKENYPDESENGTERFCKGEEVKVLGVSPKKGFLIVEGHNLTLHVPYSVLDFQTIPTEPQNIADMPGLNV